MADGRYHFHPMERRGVLFGLDATQIMTVVGGLVVAAVVRDVVGGRPGLVVGAGAALAGLVLGVWTNDGQPAGRVALLTVRRTWQRWRGMRLDPAPLEGSVGSLWPPDRSSARTPSGVVVLPWGVELFDDRGLPGEDPIGVMHDRRVGRWGAVVPVGGCALSLMDPSGQVEVLDGWRRVLGAVGRAGGPVVRLQWVQRSWTGGGEDPVEIPDPLGPPGAGPPATASYRELVASSLSGSVQHAAWVVVLVGSGPPRRPAPHALRDRGPGRIIELRREIRLLDGQLRMAGLRPGRVLDAKGVGSVLAASFDRMACGRTPNGRFHGPLASEDRWSTCRIDALWHATYWIAEWPRVEVGPDFLSPVLLLGVRTAVSVTMAPVATERAVREVRAARTADVADSELRARAGFLSNARRERESEGVARREVELADGHHEFRFSGYLTVSAPDVERLSLACAEVEQAAQSARLALRRMYGRQQEAFTWTLPLGRGLR